MVRGVLGSLVQIRGDNDDHPQPCRSSEEPGERQPGTPPLPFSLPLPLPTPLSITRPAAIVTRHPPNKRIFPSVSSFFPFLFPIFFFFFVFTRFDPRTSSSVSSGYSLSLSLSGFFLFFSQIHRRRTTSPHVWFHIDRSWRGRDKRSTTCFIAFRTCAPRYRGNAREDGARGLSRFVEVCWGVTLGRKFE